MSTVGISKHNSLSHYTYPLIQLPGCKDYNILKYNNLKYLRSKEVFFEIVSAESANWEECADSLSIFILNTRKLSLLFIEECLSFALFLSLLDPRRFKLYDAYGRQQEYGVQKMSSIRSTHSATSNTKQNRARYPKYYLQFLQSRQTLNAASFHRRDVVVINGTANGQITKVQLQY